MREDRFGIGQISKEVMIRSSPLTLLMIVLTVMILSYYALLNIELVSEVSRYYIYMIILGTTIMVALGGIRMVRFGYVKRYLVTGVILTAIVMIIAQSIVFAFAPLEIKPIQVALIVLFAGAVAEEWAFRGGFLNAQLMFTPKVPSALLLTIITNGVIFALFHSVAMKTIYLTVNVFYMLAIFSSGVILALVAILTKDLTIPILAHFIFNVIAVNIPSFLLPLMTIGDIMKIMSLGIVLGVFIAIWEILRRKGLSLKDKKEQYITIILGSLLILISLYLEQPWLIAMIVSFIVLQFWDRIMIVVNRIFMRFKKTERVEFPPINMDLAMKISRDYIKGMRVIKEAGDSKLMVGVIEGEKDERRD